MFSSSSSFESLLDSKPPTESRRVVAKRNTFPLFYK
jgi:hypothetical protein